MMHCPFGFQRNKQTSICEPTWQTKRSIPHFVPHTVDASITEPNAVIDMKKEHTNTKLLTDNGPSRISLRIFAHGGDITTRRNFKFYKFELDRDAITILNCGIGQCGLDSWCNYESLNELSEVIDKATITHNPNTFETMENIMPTVKQMYKTIHNAPPIAAPCRENEVVDKNEQCKIYHPHLDRNYSDEPTQFICTILQVFNAPLYKKLVGYELYEPEAIQTFIDAQPLNKNAITKFASHFTGVYYRVNLSEIVAFCKLLGFQYVNVYEFACRPLWHPKTGVFTNKKIENKVNMIESNTRKRKSMLLGGVKC